MTVNTEENIKNNKLKWFFFIIVIPLLFSIVLFFVVLTVAGVNIEKETKAIMKKIPFLEQYADDSRKDKMIDRLKDDQLKLEAQIQEKAKSEKKLKQEIAKKNEEINNLQQELQSLQESKSVQASTIKGDIAETFTGMRPEKAADILSKMTTDDAFRIFIKLEPEIAASILENMKSTMAAEISKRLSIANR